MASSEKFCLRWNDFEANVSGAFRELREEKDFFDVTLACEDNQLEAHKVIISACSPFFRNVLRRNPHQHPLLYLKGVKYRELVAVLNFMYQGEVNVAQDDLNTFLSVAEELQVKGLTQGNNGQQQSSKPSGSGSSKSEVKPSLPPPPPSRNVPDVPVSKKPRLSNPAPVVSQSTYQSGGNDDDDIQEVVPVKSEPGSSSMVMDQGHYQDDQSGAVALEDSYQEEGYDYEGYDDGSGVIDPNTGLPYAGADGNKGVVESMTSLGGGQLQCLTCGYQSKSTNIKYHIEAKHVESSGYNCALCGDFFKARSSLNQHMSVKHRKARIN